MTPFLMLWLARESVDVDAVGMFTSILFVTILPVALGFVLNTAFGTRTGFGEVKKVLPGVAVAGLACIVGGVVSAHGQKFAQSGVIVFVAVFCHNALGYVLGYSVGRLFKFNTAKKRTIAIEVGVQNAGMATVLAAGFFATPENLALHPEAALCVVPCALSCIYHSISGTILANIFAWMDGRKATAK
jgi:BASS family bile acid:Na+ symporter